MSDLMTYCTSWTKVPAWQQEKRFNNFKPKFLWDPSLEVAARDRYMEVVKPRYKDNMFKVANEGKAEKVLIIGASLEQYNKARSDPKFRKRSAQAKKNKRRGDPEAEVDGAYALQWITVDAPAGYGFEEQNRTTP